MTVKEIKEDLKEIRFYYANQDMFNRSAKVVSAEAILHIVDKYNNAIKNASGKLYLLYMSLYVYNNSQITLADDWGTTAEKICTYNQQLIDFLQKHLS